MLSDSLSETNQIIHNKLIDKDNELIQAGQLAQ